jgi:hypothetical protein
VVAATAHFQFRCRSPERKSGDRRGLPATNQLQAIDKPLSVGATPYRNPASEWRSARERHGQNDVMPGVRRYDFR